jgi:hypothetical protein
MNETEQQIAIARQLIETAADYLDKAAKGAAGLPNPRQTKGPARTARVGGKACPRVLPFPSDGAKDP